VRPFREQAMAFDEIRAEITRLLSEMEKRPADRHELYLALRGKLNEIRAMGMPLPDDLIRFEDELEAEFAADRQGRSPPRQPRRHGKAPRS
jgi:hypothetical protein